VHQDVAGLYLGKVIEVFPLNPSGFEMAAKILGWDNFLSPGYTLSVQVAQQLSCALMTFLGI
jgi:hypothetical protein